MKSIEEEREQFVHRRSEAGLLTRMLCFLCAHTAPPAARFRSSWGHWGQQWVGDTNRREGIVHQDVFQVGAHLPGDAVGWAALRHSAEVVGEGDGTVREIQGRRTRQVCLVLHKFLAAVLENRFLLNDPVHQIRRAETRGWEKGKSMRSSLHLELLYSEQQVPVCVFQLLLSVFKVLSTLLFPLQLPDVVHGGLQNGSLVPPHVRIIWLGNQST